MTATNNKCRCGNDKYYKSRRCHSCKSKDCLEARLNKTIKECFVKGNSRVRYANIRRLARQIMELSSNKKECYICGFDTCIEVAHIKSLISFPDSALMKEVNCLSNLIYLCPNHHTMLDKSLISVVQYGPIV